MIVKDFLETLTNEDMVWIYTFNESNQPLMIPEIPFTVTESSTLEKLTDSIDNIPNPDRPAAGNATNLTEALIRVIDARFNDAKSSTSEQRLKMLVIIAGENPGLTPSPSLVEKLNGREVRTFISQWGPSFLSNQGFENIGNHACDIMASYTTIFRDRFFTNHLAGLQPFYDYVAKLRFDNHPVKGPAVGKYYGSYSSVGKLKYVSYPAFSRGKLIGVASVAFPELLSSGATSDEPLEAAQYATNLDCRSNENFGPSENCSGLIMRNFDCVTNDESLDEKDYDIRTCCREGCKVQYRKSNSKAVLIAAPIGAATVLILAIVLGFLCWRRAMSNATNKSRDRISDLPNSSTAIHSSTSTQANFSDRL